ncbi:MAG TPA: aldehyde dehydrogenase family protein [Cytophagales bacterium]|nr:aldehyde dehydrogenase family protein [Cytophagales bacterium]
MEAVGKIQSMDIKAILDRLGIKEESFPYSTGQQWGGNKGSNQKIIYSPIDNKKIATVNIASEEDYKQVVKVAKEAFTTWVNIPAPKRGDLIRQIGDNLRKHKNDLGALVTIEMGKIYQEGLGEVQEMIDICDFAVGLSRQLHGFTMHSERPKHRMYEQYHPLGIIGIISAFNFPVAVWSWNAMLALACGNVCIWKPSEKTPLTAIACQNIVSQVFKENGIPEGVLNLVIGDPKIGALMANDDNIPLISATGSTRMGKAVGEAVGKRLGRFLLELGGNNAIIVTPNADLELVLRAVVFGAVGTCGQRCTSTRRLIVHESVYEELKGKLLKAYQNLPIGNPLDSKVLIGPMIDKEAVKGFVNALEKVQREGGKLLTGGTVKRGGNLDAGNFVDPAIVEVEKQYETVQEETFAPILYMLKYQGEVENAIRLQNDVKQGLSSSIFTTNLIESEKFLSHVGSDCGIANVNIGTSGAEIGGAFGGEKDTGGGRESGSDAWKIYMRRQTNTINFGQELPLAQGIQFDF